MVIDPNFGAFQPFLRDLKNPDSEVSRLRAKMTEEEQSIAASLRAENERLNRVTKAQQIVIEALEHIKTLTDTKLCPWVPNKKRTYENLMEVYDDACSRYEAARAHLEETMNATA